MKGKPQPMGCKAVRGSDAARRLAALLLEAWCGVRTTQSASEAMGVALPRYYQLEARVLEAIVLALEPRSRGRKTTPASELAKLRSERNKILRQVERYQTLYRVSQRALGVSEAKVAKAGKETGKRRRRPRQRARAEVIAATLQRPAEGGNADGATEQGNEACGRSGGRTDGEGTAGGDRADADGRAVRGGGV